MLPVMKVLGGWRLSGPYLAIATAPASLMLGGGIAQQMPFEAVPWALLAGGAALWLLASLQGRLGVLTRRPLVVLVRPVLGARLARWTSSALVTLLMMGWFGFGIGVAGRSLARLTGLPEAAALALWTLALLAGLWRGLARGSLLALLGSLATLVLVGQGLLQVGRLAEAPAPLPAGRGNAWSGMALVVGYGAAFTLRCVDFTAHMRRARQVWWTSLLALSLPLVLVAGAGAWMTHAAGTWDLSLLLDRLGFPTLAHLFVIVGFWGAGLTNLYSGSLALQDLFPRHAASATPRTETRSLLVMNVAGYLLALAGFERAMVGWLHFLSVVVVPLVGVILIHYLRAPRPGAAPAVHLAGLGAWTLGIVTALILPATWPRALVGVLVAAGAYTLLVRFERRRSDPS